jgi:nucleotide-binding universal stress UspA family protein
MNSDSLAYCPPDVKSHARRILVCLDRSPSSEVCLPYAVSLAKTFGSALTLLYVMQPPHEHVGVKTTDALDWEISRQEARAYLERLEKEATQALGQAVEVRLEQGHPAERIVALCRELGVEFTLLGSHGEGGVTAWNLGSTVQQVLAVTRGSVFIAHASLVVPSGGAPKRILVPLDGSPRTESVLPTVTRIASAAGAEMLLVHVVQEPLPSSVLPAGKDLELAQKLATQLESSATRYLERLRGGLTHEVTSVRALVIRHANECQGLLEIARKEQTDLIVLSAHGSACDPIRTFGSCTVYLLTHSMVPLLVLQDVPDYGLYRVEHVDKELAPQLRASFPPEGV